MLASRLEDHDTRLEAGKRVQAVGSRWPHRGDWGQPLLLISPLRNFAEFTEGSPRVRKSSQNLRVGKKSRFSKKKQQDNCRPFQQTQPSPPDRCCFVSNPHGLCCGYT